jgi:hypothetical protein
MGILVQEKKDSFGYSIEMKIVYADDEKSSFDLNENLLSLTITKEFDANLFPILECHVGMNHEQYQKFRKDYTTSVVVISIKEHKLGYEQDYDPMAKLLFIKRFAVIDPEDMTVPDEETSDKTNTYDPVFFFKLNLFPKNHLKFNKSILNTVFNNSNLTDVTTALLSKVSPKSKIVQSPVQNHEKHRSILVPPSNIKDALLYLQDVYGIYENGLFLFFDFEYLWVLDRKKRTSPTTTYSNKVLLEFVKPITSDLEGVDGSIEDSAKKMFRVRTRDKPTIIYNSIAVNELLGEHITIGSQSDSKTSNKECYSMDDRTTNDSDILKEKFLWDPMSNPFKRSSFTNDIREKREVLIISFASAQVSIFTPDKKYFYTSDSVETASDNKYYRLTDSTTIFSRTTGSKLFMNVTHLKLMIE